MYKKFMGKFEITKEKGRAIVSQTLFFDTEEEIHDFIKNNDVRIEVIFKLVKLDPSKYL